MGLKTPAEYAQSLRDGRVTYWDGERIDDITVHPKFRIPIEVASRDYDYADPSRREVMAYETEDGAAAHRVFQIPRSEADLEKRIELMHEMSIVGGVTEALFTTSTLSLGMHTVTATYSGDSNLSPSGATLISAGVGAFLVTKELAS